MIGGGKNKFSQSKATPEGYFVIFPISRGFAPPRGIEYIFSFIFFAENEPQATYMSAHVWV